MRFWTYHPEMVEVDAENFTVQRFPAVLTGTLLLIFGLISLRFKAALIPIKLIFTIVVPILFVYGLAVLVSTPLPRRSLIVRLVSFRSIRKEL